MPEDSFVNDNQYFFTYGNQGMLRVAVRCKDNKREKFIIAAYELDPENLYLDKNFTLESTKLNENDLLIHQGSFSQNEEGQVLEFIKSGGRIALFPEFEEESKSYAFQNGRPLNLPPKTIFLKSASGRGIKESFATQQMEGS